MSRLRDSRQEMDTVAFDKQFGDRRAFDIILQAQVYWDKMDRFRKERERNKKYCYGDQWQDIVTDEDGCTMTEEEYIKKQGSVPLKNNLIRRLVRNVLGVYRSQAKEPICTARDRDEQRAGETMSSVLQYNWQMNRMQEINARTMEDFLIGGIIVHRKWYGWQNDRMDCWTSYVNPNNFFIDNRFRDFRGWDVTFLGEIHDISFPTLIQTFAKSEKDYKRLRDIYAYAAGAFGKVDANTNALFVSGAAAGYMNNTPADLFERYLKTGMGGEPMIVDYEKSMIDFANSSPDAFNQVKSSIRILYPSPTIWNSHCFMVFTDAGAKLYKALNDPEIANIAWSKYGFRTGVTGGSYDVSNIGLGVPQAITSTVTSLKMDTYNKLIDYLKEN